MPPSIKPDLRSDAEKAKEYERLKQEQRERGKISQYNRYHNDPQHRKEKNELNNLYKQKAKYEKMGFTFSTGKEGIEEVKILIKKINKEEDEFVSKFDDTFKELKIQVDQKKELIQQKQTEVKLLIKEVKQLQKLF